MEYYPQKNTLTLSERIYRFLLIAYPRAFRAEYASEMLMVFREALDDARRHKGIPGILSLWRDTFEDYAKSVCIEHIRNWMERSQRDRALAGKDHLAMAFQYSLDIAQRTDIGLKRPSNEDNLVAVVPTDQLLLQSKGALFVVSDGMGGHDFGEVASEMTIRSVKEHYYQDALNTIPTSLQQAVEQANIPIRQANEEQMAQGGKGMGATCVAAVLHDQALYVANVGDSRAYLLHAGQLRQITRDHSYVAQLLEKGEITPAEARTHEKRNIITRSLGAATIEVDLFTAPVEEGDTLVLCTDGLCGVIEDHELLAIVEQYDPVESVQHLIAQANEAGGPDNVTAIVVRVSAA